MHVHQLHACTLATCMYTSYMHVPQLHACTLATCMYTSYMHVHQLHACTCMYTSYMHVHQIHACTLATCMYTSYMHVHQLHACTLATCMYMHVLTLRKRRTASYMYIATLARSNILVSFSKGPGDALDSPLITIATTPRKTPTPTQVTLPPLSTEGETTPSSAGPDLDRSAMSVTRDHLTSGGVGNVVSLSGDYKDSAGRVIRRCVRVCTFLKLLAQTNFSDF